MVVVIARQLVGRAEETENDPSQVRSLLPGSPPAQTLKKRAWATRGTGGVAVEGGIGQTGCLRNKFQVDYSFVSRGINNNPEVSFMRFPHGLEVVSRVCGSIHTLL